MFNFIHFFLILIYFSLNLVCSQQSDVGVSDDFKDMLRTPGAPSSTKENFATHVTRPFVQNPKQDKRFFSDPKVSRPNWDQQHRDWSKTQNSTSPLNIFEAMGISRRGLLSNDPAKYRNISNAQTQGMLRIIRGDLDFLDRSCTRDEELIIARELLNIGRSMSGVILAADIADLERAYNREINAARKQHMQISALLMLQGAKSPIEDGKWYLADLENKNAVLEKVRRHYDNLFAAPINQADYERLVKTAAAQNWTQVNTEIQRFPAGSGPPQQRSVIEAIIHLNDHHRENRGNLTDSLWLDMTILNKESRRFSPAVPPSVPPQQRLEQYLGDSSILSSYAGDKKEEMSGVLREAVSTWIQQNDGQWPGKDQLDIAEQFFHNLSKYSYPEDLIKITFGVKSQKSWDDFMTFSKPLLDALGAQGDEINEKSRLEILRYVFYAYQGFSTFEERVDFLEFCRPYLVGHQTWAAPSNMNYLLPVYKAFPVLADRERFLEFYSYFGGGAMGMEDFIPIYQAFPEPGQDRDGFIVFCDQHKGGGNISTLRMKRLLPVYLAFPILAEREAFLRFCKPYTDQIRESSFGSSSMDNKPEVLNALLPIYQAFSTSLEISSFLNFCDTEVRKVLSPTYETQGEFLEREKSGSLIPYDPYVDRRSMGQKIDDMKTLLPVYKLVDQEGFLRFCESYCKIQSTILIQLMTEDRLRHPDPLRDAIPVENDCKISPNLFHMANLVPAFKEFTALEDREDFLSFHARLGGRDQYDIKNYIPIYRAFSASTEREEFLNFCRPYLQRDLMSAITFAPLSRAQDLLTVYKALPSPEGQAAFQDFCHPYVEREMAAGKPSLMKALLPIYLSDQMADFDAFIRPHLNMGLRSETIRPLIFSYLPRHYLGYMRIHGAFNTEQNVRRARVQAMYETGTDDSLPALWGADPFLQQARNMFGVGFANAHDFDDIYELDRPILWGQTDRYNDRVSSASRTIHNGEASKIHQTNEEVEDFIRYLDTTIAAGPDIQISRAVRLNGAQAVSIIKQMFGLEPKSGATSGGFAPYLSSSMYYAKPESPLGDEMLGRTWFYMKSLPGNSGDKDDYKKSVVLALLEAAEISAAGIDTHCQTRITGEMMKLVSQTLPGSNLRPLIAATDLPVGHAGANIETRITAAPFGAQILFRTIKGESSGEVGKVIRHYNDTEGAAPPLWKLYEAYYDELYRRTKNANGIGYRLDENVLMRDDHGNLVKKYNADGSVRAVPVVFYHQAEFQVFEKVFTDLMKREFEEQRGVTY